MHRKSISKGKSRRLFYKGDRVLRRNIDPAPMRGGIRL